MKINSDMLNRQANILDDKVNRFYSNTNKIIQELIKLENIIRNEDYDIFNIINKLEDNYIYLSKFVYDEYNIIVSKIKKYAELTTINEENLLYTISEIEYTLKNIQNILSSY